MPELPFGTQIGDYEVVARIALGGMSEVYEARHRITHARVAIKLLLEEWCADGELLARFRNEGRMLEELAHPHIVTLLAQGSLPDDRPFLVLEWLPGTLGQVLRHGGALAAAHALRITAQLAGALESLHVRGFVHRDLKPENVLFAGDDLATAQMKLADLGLAKRLASATLEPGFIEKKVGPLVLLPISTGGSAVLGTGEYMAPEQWVQSKTVGPETDVYALGVLLFQLLAGRLPFISEQPQGLMYSHVMEPPPLALITQHVPPDALVLLAQMLKKKSAARPSMRDAAARLTAKI